MRTRWPLRPPAETFQTLMLAYAVGTVLVVRLYLAMTGYPQVGTGGLHVAHLLWGGLLMLAGGNILLMVYGKGARRAGAITLGIGFGLFVDEVGKFVTRDNNYFYRPAAAIIYTTFVALYFVVQTVRHYWATVTDRVLLLEGVEALEEVIRGDFDVREQVLAVAALDRAATAGSPYAPLAQALRELVAEQAALPLPRPSPLVRRLRALRDWVVTLPGYREWLVKALGLAAAVFVGKALLQAAAVLALVFGDPMAIGGLGRLTIIDPAHATAAALQTGAALLASLFAAHSIWLLRRDLPAGLLQLSRALLLLIVVADVFGFYVAQFSATADVFLNLALLTLVHSLRTGSPLDRGEPDRLPTAVCFDK